VTPSKLLDDISSEFRAGADGYFLTRRDMECVLRLHTHLVTLLGVSNHLSTCDRSMGDSHPCTCGTQAIFRELHALQPIRQHVESADCWCHPTLNYTNEETGVQHWVHHEAN
jgi:hypothetical protein